MKKIALIILCLAILLPCAWAEEAPEAEPQEFTCGDYTYVLQEDGTAKITKFSDDNLSDGDALIIPAELDGHTVTSIDDEAFYECYSLTSVALPDSLTSIGNKAFFNCESLSDIPLPDSLTSIGEYAFAYCYNLTSVALPDSITSIGDFTFCNCDLTSVTLPDSLTSIGEYAFFACVDLTSITLPDSIISIGEDAFDECPNLTLTVPRDSYAKEYCVQNGLTYQYPDGNDWLLS